MVVFFFFFFYSQERRESRLSTVLLWTPEAFPGPNLYVFPGKLPLSHVGRKYLYVCTYLSIACYTMYVMYHVIALIVTITTLCSVFITLSRTGIYSNSTRNFASSISGQKHIHSYLTKNEIQCYLYLNFFPIFTYYNKIYFEKQY